MAVCRHTYKKYLLWCANEHVDFKFAELKSIASLANVSIKWIDRPSENPYIVVELESAQEARKLISRSLLVRSCYELWGIGCTTEELHSSVRSYPLEFVKPHIAQNKTFRIRVEGFNKTLKVSQKLQRIQSFSYLPFEGSVNLNTADTSLHMIEYYGLDPSDVPELPEKLFFGRWISDGQRELIDKFSLKKRTFIGSTSMDPMLAFIMTNLAQVKPGDIVIDPFVGTGSILVAAAQRGAYVWGWDIDYLTLHARNKPTRFKQKVRSKEESIRNNLKQYHLEDRYLDVAVMDTALSFLRKSEMINAIISDPPYGIREASERIGSNRQEGCTRENSREPDEPHFPSKVSYKLSDIYCDLLNLAAEHLIIGGRLVFWVPITRSEYSVDCLPRHPCLVLESNCEQVLNYHSSRRLLTYVKQGSPKADDKAVSHLAKVAMQFREKFFEASQISRKERVLNKNKFPTDKRGQGLAYRLEHGNKR